MYINGKWYTEPEAQAYITAMETEKEKQKEELERAKALIAQIRNFYKQTLSWGEMYEDDFLAIIGENNENTASR